MTPGQIGVVYQRVAEVRQIGFGLLAGLVIRNFRILFRQQLWNIPFP